VIWQEKYAEQYSHILWQVSAAGIDKSDSIVGIDVVP
jgi:hypothetical protein